MTEKYLDDQLANIPNSSLIHDDEDEMEALNPAYFER